NGTNYTASNTFTGITPGAHTFYARSPEGCILDTVLVIPNQRSTQNVTICDNNSYTRPSGITVNTGGMYFDTVPNFLGCDSVITTNLTVNPTFSIVQNPVICDNESYTLPGGTVVNTTGSYIDTLTAINGCDSVITTILTVNPTYRINVSDTICEYQTYALPSGSVVT